ncbi:MAG: transporter substrate-binding domain-containing protein [Leptospirales bacterium]|nr:transporter substrate-binding domain-containing protein [Leptospirales bacterium]
MSIRADLWCPFNCEAQGQQQGFMIDIAREAFALHGIQVDYALMNWARAIEETRDGKFSAIVGAYKSDAPDFIFPAEEIGRSRDIFMVQRGNRWRYRGPNSLAETKLGVVHEYGYGEEVDAYVEANRSNPDRIEVVYGDRGLDQNMRKLVLDRIGATVENETRMRYFLHRNPDIAAQVEAAGSPGVQQRTYIGFSPKRSDSAELAALLDDGIRQLRSSGRLARILEAYGLGDWK